MIDEPDARVGNELRPDLTWELRVSLFSAARGREVSTERDVWKHLDYSEPRVSNKSAPELRCGWLRKRRLASLDTSIFFFGRVQPGGLNDQ